MSHSDSSRRLLIVFGLAALWMAAVLLRVTYLQLFRYREFLARAQRQQERVIEVSPMRGVIQDRNGRDLAMSIPVDSCFADPGQISDPRMVAKLLSHVLEIPADELEQRLMQSRAFVWVARKITPQQTARIKALNLRGIYFQKENKRFYPEGKLAASVLGYVSVDEHGLGGVEYSLDKRIRGKPGRIFVMADARRRWLDRSELGADRGDNITLTLDETIQFIAEKALAEGIKRTRARAGSVVVQDPNTGQLLAVANWPTFDPNEAGQYPAQDRVDRAVSDAYEPGSIFKTILMSAALQEGMVRPSELVNCQMGSIVVAGRLIHDWHPFGILSVEQVLQNSSDVGSIKIALKLGAPKYDHYIRAFGFGQLTGIHLPGENPGLLRPLNDWTASSIGFIAIGQEISVTPIQMISADSAIANGGILRRPQIIKEVTRGTQVVLQGDPHARRVLDEKTAATMRAMMQQVVLVGTGRPAQPYGYTAAGKTGTAQKIDPATGRYSKTDYYASFVGFAPVNDPVVTILVTLDSPVGEHEGGPTAGPIFRQITEQVLSYLNVPHDMPRPPAIETAGLSPAAKRPGFASGAEKSAHPGLGGSRASSRGFLALPVSTTVAISEGQAVDVPNLVGNTVRSASQACSRLGLSPVLIGDGIAVVQSPDPGTKVLPGTKVTVHFERPGENPDANETHDE